MKVVVCPDKESRLPRQYVSRQANIVSTNTEHGVGTVRVASQNKNRIIPPRHQSITIHNPYPIVRAQTARIHEQAISHAQYLLASSGSGFHDRGENDVEATVGICRRLCWSITKSRPSIPLSA